MTKFDIGEKLDFTKESGFTHLPQNALLYELSQCSSSKERAKVRSKYEGTSDRYARGIGAWLHKLGWVERKEKGVTEDFEEATYSGKIGHAYKITYAGEQALKRADGYSRHQRSAKNIFWEMLSGGIEGDRAFLRTRRSLLLEALKRQRTVAQLVSDLSLKGVQGVDAATISEDVEGLRNIGLIIDEEASTGVLMLKDRIQHLNPPPQTPPPITQVQIVKARLRNQLVCVPLEYLNLLDLGFDGKSDRAYEVQTMRLLNKCGFHGGHRGGASRPDGVLWTQGESKDYGLIVDTKAYGDGFSCEGKYRDAMGRYLRGNIEKFPPEWWKEFPSSLDAPQDFRFLFVSGDLVRRFESQLKQLSTYANGSLGAGITSENLLLWAEEVMSKRLTLADGFARFGTLDKAVAP